MSYLKRNSKLSRWSDTVTVGKKSRLQSSWPAANHKGFYIRGVGERALTKLKQHFVFPVFTGGER